MHTCIQHQQTLYTHLTQMSGPERAREVPEGFAPDRRALVETRPAAAPGRTTCYG